MSDRLRLKYFRFGLICVCAAIFTGCGVRPPLGDDTAQPGESHLAAESENEEAEIPSEFLAGARVYEANCELCHDKGEEGAPRIGNPLQWSERLAKGQATLTKHAIEGFEGTRGEMPPQGGDLSDDEVGEAVKYMLFRYQAATTKKN